MLKLQADSTAGYILPGDGVAHRKSAMGNEAPYLKRISPLLPVSRTELQTLKRAKLSPEVPFLAQLLPEFVIEAGAIVKCKCPVHF